jgi:hypothetical protein
MFVGDSGNRSIQGYHDGTLVIWKPIQAEERRHRFPYFVRAVSRDGLEEGKAFLLPPYEPFSPGFNTVAEADRYIASRRNPEPESGAVSHSPFVILNSQLER